MKKIVSIVAVLILVLALTVSALATTVVEVKKGAKVYPTTADSYTAVGTLSAGTTVSVKPVAGVEGGSWYKITSGSMSGKYIKASAATMKSTLGKVAIKCFAYSSASTKSPIGVLKVGSTYTVTGAKKGYYRIKKGNKTGWVKKSNMILEAAEVMPAPAKPVSLGKVKITKDTFVYKSASYKSKVIGAASKNDTFSVVAISEKGGVCIYSSNGIGWIPTAYCKKVK